MLSATQSLCGRAALTLPVIRLANPGQVEKRFDFAGEAEQIDETLGFLLVVDSVRAESGQIFPVERILRFSSSDDHVSLEELQPHGSGDARLGGVHEPVQSLPQRGEPLAVVNQLGVLRREQILEVKGGAVEGQALEFPVR